MRIFFFKQKTAYEVRISDWSSDVCSSDLLDSQERRRTGAHPPPVAQQSLWPRGTGLRRQGRPSRLDDRDRPALAEESADRGRRGRAVGGRRLRLCGRGRSEERRVGKEWVVRVNLGGRRSIKKTKQYKETNS